MKSEADARSKGFANGDTYKLLKQDFNLVNPNAKIQTTLNKRATPPGTFSSVPIIGEVFENDFIPRNSDATVRRFV